MVRVYIVHFYVSIKPLSTFWYDPLKVMGVIVCYNTCIKLCCLKDIPPLIYSIHIPDLGGGLLLNIIMPHRIIMADEVNISLHKT